MAYNMKSEEDVKEYLKNLGTEYRFGCFSEKNPEVCHLLADFLEAVKKDFKKAAQVYKTNCDDHKYPRSCYRYANYVAVGKGGTKANMRTAYEYFEKGCKGNVDRSCFQQGLFLISNYSKYGIQKDVKKVSTLEELLEKACQLQYDEACYHASGVYIDGLRNEDDSNKEGPVKYYVPKDMAKAFKYAKEGCDLGNVYCCANVSQMYRKGDGVKQDLEMAEKYKEIAIDIQTQMHSNKTLKFQQGIDD